ncbi:hypothetical protein [Kyrpidia spormannii]|uniref:Uncharacterized protein n=2 Tax=Kyrpidia spormannii TaxID=2055160 RepID=A0ACA8Z548_9BACL|nr:hypothetical protein [Kyrpidia spormannii]CAB3389440.1 conserved membrane protein of unknown function [Kyrpidia spormannii]CAB3390164.1 conserved membrane protein of unknown function [Kyrpidia spormannii]
MRNLWEIGLAILVFVLLTQGLQVLTGWGMIEAIAILSIPFSWTWSAWVGQSRQFWTLLRKQGRSIQTLQNTFAVFTAAGFLIQCLGLSPYLARINESFVHVSWAVGPALFVAIVPWVIVLLSLLGLHPVVAITLLGSSLNPSILHVSPFWLAITLFGAGIVTFIVSPFNPTVNVTSAVSRIEPFTIIRWNLLFSLLFLTFVTAFAALGQALSTSL